MRTGSRLVVGLVAFSLVSSIGVSVARPAEAALNDMAHAQVEPSIAGHPAAAAVPATRSAAPALHGTPAVTWPKPGRIAATAPIHASGAAQVDLLDRAATARAGVAGLLLRVRAGQPASVRVDYRGFRHAYGGDWAARLRLATMPGCALSTPRRPACRHQTPLRTANDTAAGTATATVPAGSAGTVVALAAGPAGSTGDFAASTLSDTGSWSTGTQSGAFSYNYPFAVPPVPGGLEPAPALSYSSSAVDGQTATSNNQPSTVGNGWELTGSFVERAYPSCANDSTSNKTPDDCWGAKTNTVTLSLDGNSTQLVQTGTDTWTPADDDGTTVKHLTGATNGVHDGEHWLVTDTDGTRYYFGQSSESAWGVPVFGNDSGEPCHGATFATSWCLQAYRWNLDHVVDAHDNSMSLHYATETNAYAVNDGPAKEYVRAGRLTGISYGTREGSTAAAPASVSFGYADRCAPGADCAKHVTASWPDVPWDQNCTKDSTCATTAPTFWTTQRLATVSTSAAGKADSWTLQQSYPDPGDNSGAGLWLGGISHDGFAGQATSLPTPQVTFDQDLDPSHRETYPNRITHEGNAYPPMDKYRIHTIHNESGGVITVDYAPSDCLQGLPAAADSNTKRCFPVYWIPQGGQPRTDWFAKYVVTEIRQTDLVGGNKDQDTHYDYDSTGGAWHYSDDPLVPKEHRTWSEWRGYEKVTVREGDPANEADPVQTAVQYHYFRGMDGDHNADGSSKRRSIIDSQGGSKVDTDHFAGMQREVITDNGPGGAVVSSQTDTPWDHGPTATQTFAGTLAPVQAWVTGTSQSTTRTAVGTGWRTTSVDTTLDDLGLPTAVNDHGDTSTADDDQCTTTSYARNTARNILTLPSRVTTVGVACGTTPSYPRDAISDVRNYYDNGAFGAAPSAGNLTSTETAASYAGSTPSWVTTGRTGYDPYGRVTSTTDAMNRTTTTTFTDSTAGLQVGQQVSNPLKQVATTTFLPTTGLPASIVTASGRRTDLTYDALGRLTAVWLPGRDKSRNLSANLTFGYSLSKQTASWQRTSSLQANGNPQTAYTFYDGFLRQRQTQQPAPGEGTPQRLGRDLVDTFYDSRGNVAATTSSYFNDSAPTGTLQVTTAAVPQTVDTVYDGADRRIDTITMRFTTEDTRTHYAYGGDHVDVTPPAGSTPTTTYTDARGQTTRLLQYRGSTPTGTADETIYGYTKAGQQASVRDAAGDRWSYGYDVRGRRTSASDPDRGPSSTTYDDDGEVLTNTDARGQVLAYGYDALGRRTEEHRDSMTGPKLASWRYDTLTDGTPAIGDRTASTRWIGTDAYTTAVTGYDAGDRPLGQQVTIPSGAAAGTYTSTVTYLATGAPGSVALPALGDLGAETVNVAYDSFGQPATLKSGTTYVSGAVYAQQGGIAQLQLGAAGAGTAVWQSAFHDVPTQRLTESLVQRATGTMNVDDEQYGYDKSGNVTAELDTLSGPTIDRQCFDYDYLQRLSEAWTTTAPDCSGAAGSAVGGPAPYWTSESYYSMGDRNTQTRHGLGGAADTTSTYHYPPTGQTHAPTSVTTTGPTGTSTASYAYGPTGDTKTRPAPSGAAQTLSWDEEDRLASAGSASFVYDADGNQLLSKDSTGTTLFLDSGELHVDTAGRATGTRYYTFAGASIAVRTGAGLTWTAGDNHATPDLAVDARTLQETKRRTDPFGTPRGAAVTFPGDHGFLGGTTDADTGLTHLGARDYDPLLGRFVSVDPVLDPADPQQLNPYEYAENNPATLADPSGLMPQCPDAYPYGCKNKHAPKKSVVDRADPPTPVFHPGGGQTRVFNDDRIQQDNDRKVAFDRAQQAQIAGIYQRAEQIRRQREEESKNHCGMAKTLCDITGVNDVLNCVSNPNVSDCVNAVIDVASYVQPELKGVKAVETAEKGAKVVDDGFDASRALPRGGTGAEGKAPVPTTEETEGVAEGAAHDRGAEEGVKTDMTGETMGTAHTETHAEVEVPVGVPIPGTEAVPGGGFALLAAALLGAAKAKWRNRGH